MGILESDKYRYGPTGDFQPAQILKDAKRTGLKYTFSFFMLAHLTLSSSYVPPLITTLFNPSYVEGPDGNVTFVQPLPYYSWMPFRYARHKFAQKSVTQIILPFKEITWRESKCILLVSSVGHVLEFSIWQFSPFRSLVELPGRQLLGDCLVCACSGVFSLMGQCFCSAADLCILFITLLFVYISNFFCICNFGFFFGVIIRDI